MKVARALLWGHTKQHWRLCPVHPAVESRTGAPIFAKAKESAIFAKAKKSRLAGSPEHSSRSSSGPSLLLFVF